MSHTFQGVLTHAWPWARKNDGNFVDHIFHEISRRMAERKQKTKFSSDEFNILASKIKEYREIITAKFSGVFPNKQKTEAWSSTTAALNADGKASNQRIEEEVDWLEQCLQEKDHLTRRQPNLEEGGCWDWRKWGTCTFRATERDWHR